MTAKLLAGVLAGLLVGLAAPVWAADMETDKPPAFIWRQPPVLKSMVAQTRPSGALSVYLQGRPWSGDMLARSAPASNTFFDEPPPAQVDPGIWKEEPELRWVWPYGVVNK